ncbi:ankyrin-1-like [Triticum dicoccoides]|uniref:ankyrin-1-like n=1 Tax=Triticum dicoccoides TaxID=85692 RepID=UPI00188DCAE9|nr:ankyrin-1-like [Triticum dicoccoides]
MEAPFVYLRPTVEDDGTGSVGTRKKSEGWEEIGGEEDRGDYCCISRHVKAIWRFAGATPFLLFAQSGHVSTVKYFLDHGGDLVKGDNKGQTVLHHAMCIGCCNVTEFLLSKGLPVDIDRGHGTPLYMAALNEQDKTVKILLDHHGNPNIIINGANSLLMSALVYRSLKCMKLLIKVTTIVVLCKSYSELGRLPVELAAICDYMEEVEMLFPVTSPIPNVPNWSIEGVISHAKIEEKKSIEQRHLERRKSLFKSHADKAFKQKDYKMATKFIDMAIEHTESVTLYANRSLCKLLMDDGEGALSDALMCRMLRPDWAKACYRQGAAHMLLKEYKQACDALLDAQNLDPGNAKIEGELR